MKPRKFPCISTEPGTPVKRDSYPGLYYLVSVHAEENKASIIKCKENREDLDLKTLLKEHIPNLHLLPDSTQPFAKTVELLGKVYNVSRDTENIDLVHVCREGDKKIRQWRYPLYRSMIFHMNLAKEMRNISASLVHYKNRALKDHLRTLFGPNSGTSVLFNSTSTNSTILRATCFFKRIPYLALMDKPNGTYYLSSRSYTSIPPKGRGLKVAFTAAKVIIKADEVHKINTLEWRFGIVAGMDNGQVFLYESVPCHRGVKLFKHLRHYKLDEVTLVGLNEVCPDLVHNGFVISSGFGPDTMPPESVIQKAKKNKNLWKDANQLLANAKNKGFKMKSCPLNRKHCDVSKFVSKEITSGQMAKKPESLATRKIDPANFMRCYKHHRKRNSMANAGATIVIIAGPTSLLKHRKAESGLWCPMVKDIKLKNNWTQRYAKLSQKDLKSNNFTSKNLSHEAFDSMFENKEILELKCYDLEKYENGLLFAYKIDDTRTHMTVIEEKICKEPMEHWEVFSRESGVVLSHSILDHRIHTITKDDYDCIRNFTRGSTYGNGRDVCESSGGNFYGGCKLSARAIPKPE